MTWAQLQAETGSQLYRALHAVADGLAPEHRAVFREAIDRIRGTVDEQALRAAVRAKNTDAVVNALGLGRLKGELRQGMEGVYRRTLIAGGEATTEEAVRAGLFEMSFSRTNPNAILAARRDVGTLITQIDNETRLAVRAIAGDMFTSGVPPAKAAPRLRSVLGLTGPQSDYVTHFEGLLDDLQRIGPEADDFAETLYRATDRRLDAVTKGRIRKMAREGNLTDDLIAEFRDTYSDSMLNRRALNISRTESLRAAHSGQQESWRQAVQRGHLDPQRTRRQAVTTPDDRLRETHAAVPGMNEGGVGLEEPLQTPMGPMMYPPWETNCRCSISLLFSSGGVL